MISTPLRFEAWVPERARDALLAGLEDGLHTFGEPGEARTIVWSRSTNGVRETQIFQYLPENPEAYLQAFGGDEHAARLYAKTAGEWNRAMRHFVEERGWSPEEARAEIRRIDEELLELAVLGAAMMVTSGAMLPARALVTTTPAAAERARLILQQRQTVDAGAPPIAPAETSGLPAANTRMLRGERGELASGGFARGLTRDEVGALHRRLGGPGPYRGKDVSSALAAASHQPGFWRKVAALLRDMVGGHTFRDANKRTAFEVVKELQRRNEIQSGASDAAIRDVITDIASGKLKDIDEIATRLRGF